MRSTAVSATILALVVLAGLPAGAVDQPISGAKLVLKRSATKASLTFVSKDPSAPFPAIGGFDDPAAGVPGGLVVELFSAVEGTGGLVVPAGVGKPGWKVTDASVDSFKYVNSDAPDGPSPVRAVVLKDGKQVKIVAKSVPFPLAVPQTSVGIRITTGSLRRCARFDPPTFKRNVVGSLVAREAPASALTDCSDASLLGNGSTSTTTTPGSSTTTTTAGAGCPTQDTFETIQKRIFDEKGCSVATCHGAFGNGNLDLRPGASYVELIDVVASNPIAAAANKKLVAPGDAVGSFLSQKLHGTLAAGEGTRMPLIGDSLSATELAVVDAWIDAGAPQIGSAPGAPCLPAPVYVPAPALTPPPGGYQIVLNGPTLQPGQEQEGCMWIPVPSPTDFYVGKWEFSLNPGTHHFAIFDWNRAGAPTTGVWTANDFGCFSGTQFGNNITGSPQAPYYVDAYPTGVGRRLQAGHYLGLNAHYYNQFTVPIQMKVWINAYPYGGTPPHLATTIVDIDDTFGINVPPFTVQVFPPPGQARARWTNTSGVNRNIIFLGGHMHFRGLRFTVWSSTGTKLYESFDWAHPNSRVFTPGLVLPPGGYLDYECEYDNGVSRPVRTDGFGNPTSLLFGVSAEDAMCIVTGSYYE